MPPEPRSSSRMVAAGVLLCAGAIEIVRPAARDRDDWHTRRVQRRADGPVPALTILEPDKFSNRASAFRHDPDRTLIDVANELVRIDAEIVVHRGQDIAVVDRT